MRVLRWALLTWALAHVLVSAILLGSIHLGEPTGVKAGAYMFVGLGPLVVVTALTEARAIWRGHADERLAAGAAFVCVTILVGAIALVLES